VSSFLWDKTSVTVHEKVSYSALPAALAVRIDPEPTTRLTGQLLANMRFV